MALHSFWRRIFGRCSSKGNSRGKLAKAASTTTTTVVSPRSRKATNALSRFRSPPSRSDAATLPREIVFYIFELAAGDPKSGSQALATISRLCTTLRDDWALQRLYHHPNLQNHQLSLFIKTLKRSPSIANRVQRLTLNGWDPSVTSASASVQGERRGAITPRLPQILDLCHNLTDLEIIGSIIFSLTDFANGHGLVSLTLIQSVLSDRTTTSRYHPFFTSLPSLESLTLKHSFSDAPTAAHFLCHNTLPALKYLHLGVFSTIEEPTARRTTGPCEPTELAQQLESLNIRNELLGEARQLTPSSSTELTHPAFDFIKKCINLHELSLPLGAVTQAVLGNLPPRLQRLEVQSPATSRTPSSEVEPLHMLKAVNNLSLTFLHLDAECESTSTVATPMMGRSPISSVSSSPFSTLFPTPERSPVSEACALSQLLTLHVPRSWEKYGWGVHPHAKGSLQVGELDWSLGSVWRVCERRGIDVRFEDA
ncbi:BQ5605_C012g07000 [Microbotryum silenes-dioicae]|uniref:BQ5605_C012g07000 protein n=1 Tax=Microbotryum silenes-dioicae TaxID=796604 RepID=A0A2X0NVQ8_9BASI|nr:BQ5605_C012g07000 [Microbotryum silenes-dioicae]